MSLCATADSAEFYSGGMVTYSNKAKRKLLQVKAETLTRHTAVSKNTLFFHQTMDGVESTTQRNDISK
ncbi:CinA family protein [Serratia ureilytica]|nr:MULTISPECIES: CinA family protein [Serratia]MBH2656240.1 CinA family protein [Serratia ureilytica]MBJ2092158.1 CinA family protein [Serratia ureilytica]HBC5194930.1 CinA family protein [Serratia marcescens]